MRRLTKKIQGTYPGLHFHTHFNRVSERAPCYNKVRIISPLWTKVEGKARNIMDSLRALTRTWTGV